MDHLLVEAFLEAIYTEKRSLYFYQKVAESVEDTDTKKLFRLLADEEAEHLKRLMDSFPGDRSELLQALDKPDNLFEGIYRECLKGEDQHISLKQALEISLCEEHACIDRYATFVSSIKDINIREVFENNLDETRSHYDVILEEYKRISGMTGTSDQNIFV